MSEYIYDLKGAGGRLLVTENEVIIQRKGFTAFMLHGLKGDKTISIQNITAIQIKKANILGRGYIQFTLRGGNESRGGLHDAANDENSVLFDSGYNDYAEEIRKYILNKINNRGKNTSSQLSGADEILKYKKLLDDGIITQEEFQAKKKQLLNK